MKRKFVLIMSLLMILSTMTAFANGKEKVTWLKYDEIGNFHDGMLSVRKGDHKTGKYGYVDKNFKEVIKPQFTYTSWFSEGFATVEKNKKYGFIDKTGKLVIPYQFDFASEFSEGLAAVRKDGKWGFIDKTGKLVIPIQYRHVGAFSEGLVEFAVDSADRSGYQSGKFGYMNKKGEVVIEPQYDFYNLLRKPFSNGLSIVSKKGQGENGKETIRLVIDKENNVVFSNNNLTEDDFTNGYAMISESGPGIFRRGYINTKGEEVVPPQYDEVGDPSEGLVAVMNKVSHMVYEPKVIDLTTGEVKFTLPAGDWSVMDTKFHDGYIVMHKRIEVPGKERELGYCVFDKNGKLIIPTAKYKYIEYIGEGYWKVMKNSSKTVYGVFKLPPVK